MEAACFVHADQERDSMYVVDICCGCPQVEQAAVLDSILK